jgi:predicted ArsR family transcriptional regulator
MTLLPGTQQFFTTTRGRILLLLRRESRTVEELAQALTLTPNAVRTHLATLARDGLVEHHERRRAPRPGAGAPAYSYRLTTQGDRLFPNGYELLLDRLLAVLEVQMPPVTLTGMLQSASVQMAPADAARAPGTPLAARVAAAADVLNRMGGLVEVEEHGDSFSLCGYSCPFAAMVVTHPQLCEGVQALLTAVIQHQVDVRCSRTPALWCQFDVSPA